MSSSSNSQQQEGDRTIRLHVEGMMCQRNCGTTVENALRQVPGVLQARASFATQEAWATLPSSTTTTTTAEDLIEAIEDVGFDASLKTTSKIYLQVEGMMCQRNCGSTVQNALLQVPGVLKAEASFAGQQAWAEVPCEDVDRLQEEIVDAVECVGFDAMLITEDEALQQQQQQQQQKQSTDPPNATKEEEPSPFLSSSSDNNVIVLSVEGMSCAVCTGRVERGLLQVPGVTTAFVSLATHRAEIGYDEDGNSDSLALDCQQAVQKSGYPCQILSAGRGAGAMNLQDNAQTLEDAKHAELKSWRKLLILSITLLVPMLYIQHRMMVAMKDHDVQQQSSHHSTTSSSASGDDDEQMPSYNNYHLSTSMGQCMLAMAVLSTLIQTLVGYRYYKAAWKAGTDFGMDFLVVLGTTSSYVYSIFVWMWLLVESHTQVAPDNTQLEPTFQTGAMLLTFVTFGKFLEAYAKGKTSSALEALMRLQPLWASRVVSGLEGLENSTSTDSSDNDSQTSDEISSTSNAINLSALETQEISSWDVQIGDYLYVLPGARIPADGVIVALSSTASQQSGNAKLDSMSDHSQKAVAYIDESAFSGEPFPVPKGIGESVYGSSVNQLTVLVIRVTATGSNSVLAKIVRLMEDAQRHKAPIQALADRIASVFAPAVMGLALITFILWVLLDYEAETTQERFFLAFLSAISVVVVACPCALGLATPTAVMVGTGVGATHGLLIKGGQVLEEMQAIDTVVFDKTGTLTTGKATLGVHKELVRDLNDPLLQNVPSRVLQESKKDPGKKENSHNLALWLAACAEQQSEHPLAKAIVNATKSMWGGDVSCSQEGVSVDDFFIQPGSGVECVVRKPNWGEYTVRVGNKHWTREPVDAKSSADKEELEETEDDHEMSRLRELGQVGVYVSVLASGKPAPPDLLSNTFPSQSHHEPKRRVIGILGVVDPIESEAKSTVAALQSLGMDVWMCTGDHEVTARAVARQVGISEGNICAGVKPEQKAELITELQTRRGWNSGIVRQHGNNGVNDGSCSQVAFVGDGINDAVALARANVGVAIGAGTEVAVEAADVVLVRSSLHDVVVALHLSKVVFRRIRVNFVWAMAYNLLALPFAAGVLYPFTDFRLPPEYAGLMMAFSSVSVVTSSLLLRNYRRPMILEDGTLEGGDGILQKLLSPLERRLSSRRPMMAKFMQKQGKNYEYDDLKLQTNSTDDTACSSFEMV